MADIFLSYSPEDAAIARRYEAAFVAAGLGVWRDPAPDPAAAPGKVAEQKLRAAKAVVVLWSQSAVNMHRVQAEAAVAGNIGTLLPAMIENCNLPESFESIETAEMQGWAGDTDDQRWKYFLTNVKRVITGEKTAKLLAGKGRRQFRDGPFKSVILVVEVIVLLALFAGIWLSLHQS